MHKTISKLGLTFVIVFFLTVVGLVMLFPVSFGFSLILIGVLATPWNEFISSLFLLQYGSLNVSAIIPGLIINGVILYFLGFAINKFKKSKDSYNCP